MSSDIELILLDEAQQILEDEALARRLSQEEFERLEGAPVQVDSDSPARTKRKRTPSIDLDPVLGNWPAEEQMSEAAREEVEQMWARCLRGEELWDELAGDSTDEAYHLHALHSLLQEFRRAPAAFIKETFAKAGSYSEARAMVEDSEEVNGNKTKRPQKLAPPCEIPKLLQKEMELGREAVGIQKALSKRKQVRAGRVAQLKAVGGLGTCGCCFDDELLPEEELRCNAAEGHGFCIPCVKRAAAEFFGQGLFTLNLSAGGSSSSEPPRVSATVLRCLDTSGCEGHFLDSSLQKALPRKDYVRYSRRSAALQAAASGLEDLVACPSCDFMVQMSDRNDGIVRCLDPECGKITCRWCMQPEHGPLKCDEVEKDGETRIRTFLEEKMAEAVLRRCPKCHKPYERTEGCNHIRCPCGTHSCYLCGQELDKKRPYDHYKDGHLGGGTNDSSSKCIVYGTPKWAESKKQREDSDSWAGDCPCDRRCDAYAPGDQRGTTPATGGVEAPKCVKMTCHSHIGRTWRLVGWHPRPKRRCGNI
ncbi:unnamed protein product [Durusdinium trenchii]|uniref:RING-type domain-containing protein n=1 Tax=Durusdinium trenchii TaxID=1381693 RepID=A0ABP0NBC8_9DINO